MASVLSDIAEQLDGWFKSIREVTDENLFNIVPDGPHRDAIVLDTLSRNARIISESELDLDGKLYSPLCFFLAAGCRTLKTQLAVGHWRVALHTVVNTTQQSANARAASEKVGLEMGSPATIFKREFDEAVRQAGVASGASFLGKVDRLVALGLAINWGMRLLLAYALECSLPAGDASRKDLSWIAGLLEQLTAPTPQ